MINMENSKLLSNEPLKLLTNHVHELRKLWKSENTKNKKLKNCLIKLKEIISQGTYGININEMNAVIESALPSSRSLNNSYQFTIETKKTAQPLIFKVFALFENNLNTPNQSNSKRNTKYMIIKEKNNTSKQIVEHVI